MRPGLSLGAAPQEVTEPQCLGRRETDPPAMGCRFRVAGRAGPTGYRASPRAGRILFDIMVKPGVYAMHRDGKEYRRLEKVEE